MDRGQILTIAMIVWITVPIIAALLAIRKKRDRNFWVVATALVPPLIVILFFLPRRAKAPTRMLGDEKHNDDGFFATRD